MPTKPKSEFIVGAISNKMFAKVPSTSLPVDLGLPEIDKGEKPKGVRDNLKGVDLPELSSRMLARYSQYFTGMLSYSLALSSRADAELGAMRANAHRMRSYLRLSLGSGQKYKIDAEIDTHSSIIALENSIIEKDAFKLLVQSHVAAYDNYCKLVSREQTRRGVESQQR